MNASCGSVINDTKMIAFVRQEEDQYFVAIGPCRGVVYYEPSKLNRGRVHESIDDGEGLPDG